MAGGVWLGHNLVNAAPFLYDHELVASAARTDSGNSGDLHGFAPFTTATFVLDVTAAATEVGDTLNVFIQRKLPTGDYEDLVHFTAVLGNGGAKTFVADVFAGASAGIYGGAPKDGTLTVDNVVDLPWGNTLRVKWVVVDTGTDNASFTFSVTGNFRV